MVPSPLKPLLQQIKARLGSYPYACPLCQRRVRHFLPLATAFPSLMAEWVAHGFDLRLFAQAETLNLQQYACPHCRGNDRSRLCALFLNEEAERRRASEKPRLLDIAPSKPLRQFIRHLGCFEYRSADLLMDDVDDRIDITDMRLYPDASFDSVICSHVLEHVPDDRKALSELFRIVARGGWAIIMAPICLSLRQTIEDLELKDEAERVRQFGQSDHVRLYAKHDFIARLSDAGWAIDAMDVLHFGGDAFLRAGITQSSVLYVCRKGA